jgi:flagellar basal body P-ring protein FlgI
MTAALFKTQWYAQRCVPVFIFFLVTAVLTFFAGCGGKEKTNAAERFEQSTAGIGSGTTIGQVADIFSPDYIPVQGYAVVGELDGTGSADCPPDIREYLKHYILRYVPSTDVDKLINSPDTSVVLAEGLMPTSGKGSLFDVRVAVPGPAQTTSLEHGQLYGADLRAAGSFALTSKVLATVAGPVYIDKIDSTGNLRVGYILAGGKTADDYMMMITLRKPDFLVAGAIRNKLIERFGQNTANAVSADHVEMMLPLKYKGRKQHFIDVIKSTYLVLSNADRQKKIDELITRLTGPGDRDEAQIALEAIGKASLPELDRLLGYDDPDVRFRAARTMLNLGDDRGLDILRHTAFDTASNRRIKALDAVADSAKRSDAVAVCRRLLRDDNIEILLAAYEQLRKMDDISISDELIGRSFYLEQITLARQKLVFVTRSGQPRIAIFGGPLFCKANLFVQSDDGTITLNAPSGQEYVTVIRKIPNRPDIPPISLKCSYELGDIIRILGAEPTRREPTDQVGLAVAYSDIIALLDKMVKKGAVDCHFLAGPVPQISLK